VQPLEKARYRASDTGSAAIRAVWFDLCLGGGMAWSIFTVVEPQPRQRRL